MSEPTVSSFPQPPQDEARESEQQRGVDAIARLAHISQRPASASVFGRREPASADEAATTGPARGNESSATSAAGRPTDPVPAPAPDVPAPEPQIPTIGRLVRLSASDIWPDDASLGAWLAGDPSLLGEAIQTPLTGARVAQAPNRLLATGVGGARVAIIAERQGTTDAGLAALLTAAAMGGADTIAWVAGQPELTHGATLSWLNRTASARFFMVRVEGARIDDSAPAPLFQAVVRPPRADDPPPSAATPAPDGQGRRAEDHQGKG